MAEDVGTGAGAEHTAVSPAHGRSCGGTAECAQTMRQDRARIIQKTT